MCETHQSLFVRTWITEPSIKVFDADILIGVGKLDQSHLYFVSVAPGQHGPTAGLFPIVGTHHLWQGTRDHQSIRIVHGTNNDG